MYFYYDPKYKYTNRTLIDVSGDNNYREIDYENVDSPDTINGHIIYSLAEGEKVPTYVTETSGKRWFVTGITQLRTGKFQISMCRDILSEGSQWKQEEAYINAGLATDSCRYKKWDLPFTNTKIRQERLNFSGRSSFFVYYLNTQHLNSGALTEDDLEIKTITLPTGIAHIDYEVENLEEIPNYQFVGAGDVNRWQASRFTLQTYTYNKPLDDITGGILGQYDWTYDSSNETNDNFNVGPYNLGLFTAKIKINAAVTKIVDNTNGCRTQFRTAVKDFLDTQEASYGTSISKSQYDLLEAYVDKVIYNSTDNKFYTIRKVSNTIVHNDGLSFNDISTLTAALRGVDFPEAKSGEDKISLITSGTNKPAYFQSVQEIVSYTLEELGTTSSFDFTFKANVSKLPKSSVRCVNIVPDENISRSDIAQALMVAQTNPVNVEEDTGRIIDIQYLPFSIANTTDENIKINGISATAVSIETDDFTFDTNLSDLENINKETDTIKIVSPSRANQFVFSPYNNDGNMEFSTKVTIKPFASTIYVRPSTKGLLLADWDDKDCLIINEDFSLTKVTSQWTEYIYNNKNYSNIFERDIQGREFSRSWERRVEQANAKSDIYTARSLSAQYAKSATGNLPFISSISGALAYNLAPNQEYMQAAQLDRQYNEAVYQEGLDQARDLFNYQLENIQSQPIMPSKITTIDCKLLDGIYLEFYSTNSTELLSINNYYRYNGNRIDNYGTFEAYYGWFIRGKIIRSNFYTQPEIDEVNRRLGMGIFTEVNYD